MRKLLLVVGILNIAIVCFAGWVAWRVVRVPRRLPAVPIEMATRATIPGITARQQRKRPFRLMVTSRHQASGSTSHAGPIA